MVLTSTSIQANTLKIVNTQLMNTFQAPQLFKKTTIAKEEEDGSCLGILNGTYKLLKVIGEGLSSKVYKASRIIQNNMVAASSIPHED